MERDQPAHQHYLRSVFFEAIGDRERAAAELLNAHRATDLSAPDYFVKAYTYWSFLVDEDRLQDAKDFSLQILRDSPLEHMIDARGVVDSSYNLLHGRKAASRDGNPMRD